MCIFRALYEVVLFAKSVWQHVFVKPCLKSMLASCGDNVHFESGCKGNWENVSVGNDVHFGYNTLLMCAMAPISIGDHVMFGPNVTLITGDHRTDVPGKYLTEIKNADKLPENDLPIVLKGDNWIGANVTILKGVTIGQGAVVAAGAVVTKDVPDYAVVAGLPAKVVRLRFEKAMLEKHIEELEKRQA